MTCPKTGDQTCRCKQRKAVLTVLAVLAVLAVVVVASVLMMGPARNKVKTPKT